MKKEVRPDNLAVMLQRKRGIQKVLADELGISTGAVSQWKTGNRPVPAEYITAICRVLNVTEDELYKPMFVQHCPTDGIKGKLSAVMNNGAVKRYDNGPRLSRYGPYFAG